MAAKGFGKSVEPPPPTPATTGAAGGGGGGGGATASGDGGSGGVGSWEKEYKVSCDRRDDMRGGGGGGEGAVSHAVVFASLCFVGTQLCVPSKSCHG